MGFIPQCDVVKWTFRYLKGTKHCWRVRKGENAEVFHKLGALTVPCFLLLRFGNIVSLLTFGDSCNEGWKEFDDSFHPIEIAEIEIVV